MSRAEGARLARLLALVAFGSVPPAAAQFVPVGDETVLSRTPDISKVPRLCGDWCCWTSDFSASASSGSVMLARVSTGERWCLGDGCLPDVGVLADGRVRVAFLRFGRDGGLAVRSVTLPAAAPADAPPAVDLASGLRWADQVRVCGDVTAFSAAGADGRSRIFAAVGHSAPVPLPCEGESFRPALARDAAGAVHCVWDAYRLGPGLLDYEIWHAVLGADGRWSVPQDLSQAPCGLDMEPSVAAAPDGGLWVAWLTDRGGRRAQVFIEKLLPDGTALLPEEWPPATGDPGDERARAEGVAEPKDVMRVPAVMRRGTVAVAELMSISDPCVVVDGTGRPWLFVGGRPADSPHGELLGREVHGLVLDRDGWSEPRPVSERRLLECDLHGEAVPGDPLALRVSYQLNLMRQGPQTATRVLRAELPTPTADTPPEPELWPAAGPPLPQLPEILPELPALRELQRDGRRWRLAFADLHNHTRFSPDGTGERDAALFYARDVVGLDAVAITDHDERIGNPLTDWEYELGRRLVALYDTPDFAACMGFEWTNDHPVAEGEIAGHRNCFDTACAYRCTDAGLSTLPELYARLDADDALAMPHHLGLFHGASFQVVDAWAQPVTEVCSEHGEYEAELWHALLDDHVRSGIVGGGDDHTAHPGTSGLAGIWIEESGPPGEASVETTSLHAALKEALRERRCFGVGHDGVWLDALLDGVAPGGVLSRPPGDGAELRLEVQLEDIPRDWLSAGLNVNLVRDGDIAHPLWQQRVPPSHAFSAEARLPAPEGDACLMLRVSRSPSAASADTLLWASPIWLERR